MNQRGAFPEERVMQLMTDSNSKPTTPANDQETMRILVIEDDREAATWLLKGWTECGHIADPAADGEEGLALARERVHDVLIVDRMLPKLYGLSIIQTLRAEGVTAPVLLLSALGDVDERVKGLR